ncbi:MAG TPA: hypothetical protein VGG28_09055 [Kofleriaceae bacterium]|jgi:hypothetical protein
MSKLAILAVLASTLATACVAPEPYHYGYHHHYWAARRAYWRHGYWFNGAWVNNNIYVDPNVALPAGVTLPDVDANGTFDANGQYVAPDGQYAAPNTANGVVAPSGVATANGVVVTPPSSVQPVTPNTASGVAP